MQFGTVKVPEAEYLSPDARSISVVKVPEVEVLVASEIVTLPLAAEMALTDCESALVK
jgi:hypothetical protein